MNLREWALPVYTILVQLAAGALFVLWIIRALAAPKFGRKQVDDLIENSLLIIFITIAIGMIGAHFHLSRPWQSFLAILNIRNSWLSREIVFNLLFLTTTGILLHYQLNESDRWGRKTFLGWLAILFSALNVYCMAHIYLMPTQAAWNTPVTILSFFTTALLLGTMALIALLIMDLKYSELRQLPKAQAQAGIIKNSLGWMAAAAGVVALVIMGEQYFLLTSLSLNSQQTARVSLELLLQVYPVLLTLRIGAMILGVAGLGFVAVWQYRKHRGMSDLLVPTYVTCLLVMIGEILGRFLFYATHVRLGV